MESEVGVHTYQAQVIRSRLAETAYTRRATSYQGKKTKNDIGAQVTNRGEKKQDERETSEQNKTKQGRQLASRSVGVARYNRQKPHRATYERKKIKQQ